jgi:hypothetical protein
MKQIISVRLSRFQLEYHYEFLVVLKDLLLTFQSAMEVVGTADYENLLVQIEKEKKLIDAMRKSDFTQSIADADDRIERDVTGMNSIIDAGLHHFSPDVVDAAKSLHNRFKSFGNITRKSYETQVADINILIEDLLSDRYAGKVSLVGLSSWVTELTAAEAAFEDLISRRNTEYTGKPEEIFQDVRRESDAIYHRMTLRINAAAVMNPQPVYDSFIGELNARIEYFNTHYRHHARKNIGTADHCVVEEIPVQNHTGKAVTPIPRAYYREEGKPTVELVFAHDFYVTYRNNVEVGTAELVLHGKGLYRGTVKTTFNISRTV